MNITVIKILLKNALLIFIVMIGSQIHCINDVFSQ